MYSLHRKKNGIYANIDLFISYSVSQSVSISDGGSAPGDDVCSPDRRRRPGQLDEHRGRGLLPDPNPRVPKYFRVSNKYDLI